MWSSVGFLSNGVMSADLKHAGTDPSISDLLNILVIDEIRSSTHLEKREVGIGSKSQDFIGAFKIIKHNYLGCLQIVIGTEIFLKFK